MPTIVVQAARLLGKECRRAACTTTGGHYLAADIALLPQAAMPRFAVLQHDHPTLHWDFLLEHQGALLTWRLSAPPEDGAIVDAEQSFDHRLFYLDHEGPVSGGRGSVTRWDGGTFDWETHEPNRIVVSLAGSRLRGTFRLERAEGGAWRGRFTGIAEKES